MLTPALLNVVLPLYTVGTTPAVSLTRCLPQGVDADILLLGFGDVRHILYTAYAEKALPSRKLDITCCDIEDTILARNVFFLTLLISKDKEIPHHILWNLYYHLYVDDESLQVLQGHITKLLSACISLKQWRESEFGASFRFTNTSTLASVHNVWAKYAEALAQKDSSHYRADFEAALKPSRKHKDSQYAAGGLVYTGARAAAPLGLQTMASTELRSEVDARWEKGTTGTNIPNPLFAVALSETAALAYGGDPILSYHLASATAHLAEMSPLRPTNVDEDSPSLGLVKTAQTQFSEWVKAFRNLVSRDLVLRFATADYLSFCHVLQHKVSTGQASSRFYRRQLSMEGLDLATDEYFPEGNAPETFDVIDTSNLSDYLGALNILVSASPLLKTAPWAALYTETLEKGTDGEKQKFEEIMCGPTRTVSTMLGISPVEYWTNATAASTVDEHLAAIAGVQTAYQKPEIQSRFTWKFNEHLNGLARQVRLKLSENDFATLAHKVYQGMFANEDVMSHLSLTTEQQANRLRRQANPKYHRGSFVAFLGRLLQTVDVATDPVCRQILNKINEDSTLIFGSNSAQSLALELSSQGIYREPWLERDIVRGSRAPLFSTWSKMPEAVAVTIAIPSSHWKKVSNLALQDKVAFAVEGNLRGIQGGVATWHNIFGDVQIAFGTVSANGSRGSEGFSVAVEEDAASWLGSSHMIASFRVPTAALQVDPAHTKVSLCLQNNTHNIAYFRLKLNLGQPMAIFETDLDDGAHVYLSKHMPGQYEHPIYNSLTPAVVHEIQPKGHSSVFTANLDSSGIITSIAGHLDISSAEGRKLLVDKASVEVNKVSPFVFEILLGKEKAVYSLHFPVPVTKDGSRTRVARTSSYVEVIAPLADPATDQTLDDFVFPTIRARTGTSSSHAAAIPVTLNIPHLSLDTLPIIDVSDKRRLSFLTTLTSWMFSARERELRENRSARSGLAASARMNFKESLFSMFMLASGLQGGQTGLFAINHPEKGGIHMLIFVSSIRLDGANASVALDGAVIPFTVETIKSGRLESFLLIVQSLELCTITVNDEELVLWKKTLPALVERCRTWTHGPECEYARDGATIPLSTEPGEQVICTCGAGKLPEDFISLPEWDTAAAFSTRLAISPTYAVPFVEDVVDPVMARGLAGEAKDSGVPQDQTPKCRNCTSTEAKGGGPLKKCMRCLKVQYCSAECQRKDWKKHRSQCEKAAGQSG